MLHHEGSKLTVQISEEDGITVTGLVQHGYQVSFAIGSSLGSLDDTYVRDEAVVTDGIVIDIPCYILNETVVTDGHVPQSRTCDTRVLDKAFRYFDILLEHT